MIRRSRAWGRLCESSWGMNNNEPLRGNHTSIQAEVVLSMGPTQSIRFSTSQAYSSCFECGNFVSSYMTNQLSIPSPSWLGVTNCLQLIQVFKSMSELMRKKGTFPNAGDSKYKLHIKKFNQEFHLALKTQANPQGS